jgi:endonuclease G
MNEKFSTISILLLILCLSNKSFAQELLPTSTTGQIIKHTYYTLSYSEPNEQAEWVYYELTPAFVNGSQPRKDEFRPDPMVSTGSAQLSDYRGSGYDRGHLCPAADMKLNATSMSETFFLSNMSPQDPSFNRGIWESLEATVRSWAITEGMIYVVTAGVLTSNKGKIGASGVTVPQYYYKVIYAPKGQGKMIALVLPNEKGTKQLPEYVVSVDYVESLTGIDFFPTLNDSLKMLWKATLMLLCGLFHNIHHLLPARKVQPCNVKV